MTSPLLPTLLCYAAAVASMIATEWLRHRPHRLQQGTQHILLLGTLVAAGLVAAGTALLALRLPA